MINQYSFGHITIDNNSYGHDVQVMPGKVMRWQRAESHYFTLDELEQIIACGIADEKWPKYLVIGNGHDGVMRLDQKIEEAMADKGVIFTVAKTGEATDEYNKLEKEGKNVLGLFHLTC